MNTNERDPDKHAFDDGLDEDHYYGPRPTTTVNKKKKKKRKHQGEGEGEEANGQQVFPPSTLNRASHTTTDSVSYYNLGATFVSFYNHVTRGTSLAPIFDSKQETL